MTAKQFILDLTDPREENGTCWLCNHQFEDCDTVMVRGQYGMETAGREYQGSDGRGRTTTYSSHDRDRLRRMGVSLCRCCVETLKETVNKLSKPDYRTDSIRAIDAEFTKAAAKRRKAAKVVAADHYNPQTYVTPSLRAYYKRFLAGRVRCCEVSVVFEDDLDGATKAEKCKQLTKAAKIQTRQ